jgi:hypothetical protein
MSAKLYEEVEGEPSNYEKHRRSIVAIKHTHLCTKLDSIATKGKARRKYYVDTITKIEKVLE